MLTHRAQSVPFARTGAVSDHHRQPLLDRRFDTGRLREREARAPRASAPPNIAQQWYWSGYIPMGGALCLDLASGSLDNGAQVRLEPCNGSETVRLLPMTGDSTEHDVID